LIEDVAPEPALPRPRKQRDGRGHVVDSGPGTNGDS
jgi:hypothetical protein